ncbi:hypothetical protein [Shouchella tritolerans]|uniref:hypothetical protein n=1 Tax=Shouchella tritolerans TaxID=2979466 RepID=UPI0021E8808D|nr:hypothetical protein [Shouchella tritolerans]
MVVANFILLCEDVRYDNGEVSLVSPIPSRSFSSFPGKASFKFAFGLSDVSPQEPLKISARFELEGKTTFEELITDNEPINHSDSQENIDGFFHGEIVNIDFPEPGNYSFIIKCIDKEGMITENKAILIVRKRKDHD